MKAWIQYASDKKLPQSYVTYQAQVGFEERGVEIVPFTREELLMEKLPFAADAPVVGTIETVRRAWRQIGVEPPLPLDYPEALNPYLHRTVNATTMGEAIGDLESRQYEPGLFLKPRDSQKLFTGVAVRAFADLLQIGRFTPDLPVWTSTLVEFESEWRVFVLHGEIADARPYYGNSFLAPDEAIVREMIDTYGKSGAPSAYSLDVGVVQGGGTALVEVNDAFALGHYGLRPHKYVQLITTRWFEVTGTPLPRGW